MVGSISLTADATTPMASGATRVFTAFPLDTAATPNKVGGALLNFDLSNQVVGAPTGGAGLLIGGGGGNLGVVSPGSFLTGVTGEATFSFKAQATGSAWINVKCGPILKATLSVTVQ